MRLKLPPKVKSSNSLLAAAAPPVKMDGDQPSACGLAHGKMADRACAGLQGKIPLNLADAGGNIFSAHAAFRDLVALVDITGLAIVDDSIRAAGIGREDAGIGEKLVLEWF